MDDSDDRVTHGDDTGAGGRDEPTPAASDSPAPVDPAAGGRDAADGSARLDAPASPGGSGDATAATAAPDGPGDAAPEHGGPGDAVAATAAPDEPTDATEGLGGPVDTAAETAPGGPAGAHSGHGDDGAAQVSAAAVARGMPARPVRTDRLLDGQLQHVIVEPPSDPSVVPMVVGALAIAAVLGVVGVAAGLAEATIVQGISLGGALLLIAVALVLAATKLLPEELVVQQRHETSRLVSTAPAVSTAPVFGRRRILATAGAALAAVGTAIIVPARGIGPGADESLRVTKWEPGARAVDEFGELVRAEDVALNGIVTIWPEGAQGDAQSQTVLLRVLPDVLSDATIEHGTDEGLVAYSKICTHAGCAIAQFSADDREPATGYQLVCPCHQSTFDVTEQAAPVGGPATRPLAQLPVGVDDDGVVIATGDFLEPPGPAWWSR